jgi:hypothetical protein
MKLMLFDTAPSPPTTARFQTIGCKVISNSGCKVISNFGLTVGSNGGSNKKKNLRRSGLTVYLAGFIVFAQHAEFPEWFILPLAHIYFHAVKFGRISVGGNDFADH